MRMERGLWWVLVGPGNGWCAWFVCHIRGISVRNPMPCPPALCGSKRGKPPCENWQERYQARLPQQWDPHHIYNYEFTTFICRACVHGTTVSMSCVIAGDRLRRVPQWLHKMNLQLPSSLYGWRNWGSERLSYLPQVTERMENRRKGKNIKISHKQWNFRPVQFTLLSVLHLTGKLFWIPKSQPKGFSWHSKTGTILWNQRLTSSNYMSRELSLVATSE